MSHRDATEPQERGNPLDAVMSDHELYEIVNSPSENGDTDSSDTVRRLYFGMLDLQRGILNEMRLRVANVRTVTDAVRVVDTFALALGYTTVCNAKNAAELALNYGKPKETINEPLLTIIKKFNLPPLPGQRDDEEVKNITNGRNRNKKL